MLVALQGFSLQLECVGIGWIQLWMLWHLWQLTKIWRFGDWLSQSYSKAVDSYPHCQEIQQWGGGALRHLAIEIGDNRREVLQDGEVQLTMSRGWNWKTPQNCTIHFPGVTLRVAKGPCCSMPLQIEDIEVTKTGEAQSNFRMVDSAKCQYGSWMFMDPPLKFH